MSILPDPQRAYLDALHAKAEEVLDWDDFESAASAEPESHVFVPSEDDEPYGGYDDPEEYRAVVNAVGERDLDAKIRHWERILREHEAEERDELDRDWEADQIARYLDGRPTSREQ